MNFLKVILSVTMKELHSVNIWNLIKVWANNGFKRKKILQGGSKSLRERNF